MDMITDAAVVARHEAARAAGKAPGTTAEGGEFLTFRLGGEEYGIDILRVQEIRSYEQPTRIANAPHFIKGVVNLRGVIVPIIDLRLKLGCDTAEYNAFTVVIVLNVKGRVVGAVVDSVSDVLHQARVLAGGHVHQVGKAAAAGEVEHTRQAGASAAVAARAAAA
jgi:purine-binding chemotaxis protein CheW